MEIVLVVLIFVTASCVSVWLVRYGYKKMLIRPRDIEIPSKAVFEVKYYNSKSKTWYGHFFDDVYKSGYITNLAEDEVKVGDRVWVTVGEYDRKLGYWQVMAGRFAPESALYAIVTEHDADIGYFCIYPNANGVAISTRLQVCAGAILQIGGRYQIRITDNGYAELV